jgi:two-component system cell cycle response regulator
MVACIEKHHLDDEHARPRGPNGQPETLSGLRGDLGWWRMTTKILVVDDDFRTLKLVGLVLDQEGYDVIAAESGEEGLEKARAQNPDLIILDILMPGLDGYEVAQRLRSDPATADVPILMLTARAGLDDRVTGYEVGADDYLTKPVHRQELASRVESLLRFAASRQVPPQRP